MEKLIYIAISEGPPKIMVEAGRLNIRGSVCRGAGQMVSKLLGALKATTHRPGPFPAVVS